MCVVHGHQEQIEKHTAPKVSCVALKIQNYTYTIRHGCVFVVISLLLHLSDYTTYTAICAPFNHNPNVYVL